MPPYLVPGLINHFPVILPLKAFSCSTTLAIGDPPTSPGSPGLRTVSIFHSKPKETARGLREVISILPKTHACAGSFSFGVPEEFKTDLVVTHRWEILGAS